MNFSNEITYEVGKHIVSKIKTMFPYLVSLKRLKQISYQSCIAYQPQKVSQQMVSVA